MDKRILIALAALAGICAAILLFPSRDKVDADVAVGHDHAPDRGEVATDPAEAKGKKKKKKRRVNADEEELSPDAKQAAREANEARRATPYYQHVQAVAKRWLVLANTIGPAGQTELAEQMRTTARALRQASRPDGTEEAQKAALEAEGALLAQAGQASLDGEAAEILSYLQQAYTAATEGTQPPEAQASTMEYEPVANPDEPASDEPEPAAP